MPICAAGQAKGDHLVDRKGALFLLSGHALFEPVALSVHGQYVSLRSRGIPIDTFRSVMRIFFGP
jgi:hypothetical protein